MYKSHEPSSEFYNGLYRLSLQLNRLSKQTEAAFGLTWHQFMALKIITELSRIKVTELSTRMSLHASTAGALLDRLEARELVRRVRAVEDRRIVYVEPTKKGRDVSRSITFIADAVKTSSWQEPNPAGLEQLLQGLEQMAVAIEEHTQDRQTASA